MGVPPGWWGQKAASPWYVARPSNIASEAAIPFAFAASISSLEYEKAHSSGASTTPSKETSSTATTFLTSPPSNRSYRDLQSSKAWLRTTLRRPCRLALLPPERGQVQEHRGRDQMFATARERGVGMEDPLVLAQEHADAWLLALGVPRHAGLPVLGGAPVVVLGGHHGLVHRDVEVVVEVAAERGVPGEGPALLAPVGLDLLQRRAGDHGERSVVLVQMRQMPQVLRKVRATRASVFPLRVEHEVLDDELAVPLEHVEQTRLAVRPLENVVLLHLDHRQSLSLGA